MYRLRAVPFHSAESRLGRTGKSARATILRDCSQSTKCRIWSAAGV